MVTSIEKFSVSKEQVECFQLASMDLNPLHCNPRYASMTSFGQPVVFGILSFLKSISIWSKGKEINLTKLKILFKKPVFINQNYDLKIIDDESGEVTLEIMSGNVSFSKFTLNYKKESNSVARGYSVKIENLEQRTDYAISSDQLKSFYSILDLSINQISTAQVTFLMWTSYYVGMINPGTQALYTQLTMNIEGDDLNKIIIDNEDFHEVFNTSTIKAHASGFSSDIVIKALKRPENITYPIKDIKPKLAELQFLNGKNILISGANRGFGSVMAKVCALSGAQVVAVYNSNLEQMINVENEIKSSGGKISSLQVNLFHNESSEIIKKFLQQNNMTIDIVINNAAPTICQTKFEEFNPQSFINEFNKFFSIGVNTISLAVKELRSRGCILNISTSFLDEDVQGFSHYIAAKSAIETLMVSLSKEYQEIQFFTYRLPKMLTDQTNVAFSKDVPVNPIDKAIEMFKSLENKLINNEHNCEIIKLY